jgi:hypothetical protein
MMSAYVRRKQWESAVMASAMYGREAYSQPIVQSGNRDVVGRAKNGDVYITGDAMLKDLGFM